MGKWVGKLHQHDMPLSGIDTTPDDEGKVWECSCGGKFVLTDAGWLPESKGMLFDLTEE